MSTSSYVEGKPRGSILAIIPARGGSKGIPHKNLQLLAGRPLIAHTVENALKSSSINRVVVSTDDIEIASVARKYEAEVVPRPADISGDTASSEVALLHTLEQLNKEEGYEPDLIVFLQCTSPLTLPEDIDGTVTALLSEKADSALAVSPFHHFLWGRDNNGTVVSLNHDKRSRPLRQEQQAQYLETGAVYVMRTKGFKKAKHRFFGKTALYIIPRERCWEIDEPADLHIAEVQFLRQQEELRLQLLPDPVLALVLDFDGVFTDNSVIVSEDGKESVICNRSDGLGLSQMKKANIPIMVLSTEENPVVASRCGKLGLDYLQGLSDKRAALQDWLRRCGVNASNVVYVGNDINDLPCMELVGCSIAVNDAHRDILRVAHIVLSKPGGRGAIREVCDLILAKEEMQPDV